MKVAECREWPEWVSLAQVAKDAKGGQLLEAQNHRSPYLMFWSDRWLSFDIIFKKDAASLDPVKDPLEWDLRPLKFISSKKQV